MYAIPITPVTLDLVQELNGGVRPVIQNEPTYFILSTHGLPAKIITETKFKNLSADRTFVTISYFP